MKKVVVQASAFQWDAWYEKVGGRSIKIDAVDHYLQLIYQDQYLRLDGPINPIIHSFSRTEASHLIKTKAFELGADMVGVCQVEASDIYKGREVTERFAIAIGQKMLWRAFQTVPSQESAVECLRIYFTLGEIIIALAQFIRDLGYPCKIEHPIGDSDLLHIPIGLKAGFGELGRHGSIIHPKWGPLFRMGSIVTDMDMDIDHPIDAGIAKFCDNCRACRIYCPAKAIPDERDPSAGKDHLGNDRYIVDTAKCFPYFAKYNYCSMCLPVCVYNHKEWARDFNGHETKLWPNLIMEEPPPIVEPRPDKNFE